MSLQYPVLYRSMDARADATIQQAVRQTIADAETLWSPEKFDGVFPVNGFGIAKLKAADLKLGSAGCRYSNFWGASIATASTWETYFDCVMTDTCYAIITGVFNLDSNPDLDFIKITANGVEYTVMALDEMYGWDIATAYLSHLIIVRPEKQIKVFVKAKTAGHKALGFLGYTVAKRSYLISTL